MLNPSKRGIVLIRRSLNMRKEWSTIMQLPKVALCLFSNRVILPRISRIEEERQKIDTVTG